MRHNFFKNALIERGYLRQNIEERSDYNCLRGWENTLEKLNYKADICFVGNSLTFNSNFQKDFPEKIIINLGYSGDRIEGMIARHKQIANVHPDKIFIMAGINDLSQSYMTNERFTKLYDELVDIIIQSNPNSQIYLESILPTNNKINKGLPSAEKIVKANLAIKSIAIERSLDYVDLYSLYADSEGNLPNHFTPDGLHLNKDGYSLWSEALKFFVY